MILSLLTCIKINWEKATKDFGCASVDSMRVMTRSALKKVADAGGKEGVEAKPGRAAVGKKRKGDDATDDADKTPKKRGKKVKKEVSPVEGMYSLPATVCACVGGDVLTSSIDGSAADDEVGVKQEISE